MRKLIFGLESLGSAVILIVCVVLVINIIGRSFLNYPLPGAIELIGLLMVTYVYLPLAATQNKGGHIGVTLFIDYLHVKPKRYLKLVTTFLCLIMFAIFAWRLGIEAIASVRAGEYIAAAINFPWYPSRVIAALGVILLACELAIELVNDIKFIFNNNR